MAASVGSTLRRIGPARINGKATALPHPSLVVGVMAEAALSIGAHREVA